MGSILSLKLNLTLKVKVNCPKNNSDLNQGVLLSGPNLVILAWTVDELSLGQAHDWRTHRHTHIHAGNDNTRRPKLASGKKLAYGPAWQAALMTRLTIVSPALKRAVVFSNSSHVRNQVWGVCDICLLSSEWVIRFNGLSGDSGQRGHIVHISRVITAYTLESLSSLIQITTEQRTRSVSSGLSSN